MIGSDSGTKEIRRFVRAVAEDALALNYQLKCFWCGQPEPAGNKVVARVRSYAKQPALFATF
jgi:hypothetical protein